MVFAEIEGQLRTEGGWNMHIAIALIMALLVTAGVLWFFFAPRKRIVRRCATACRKRSSKSKAGITQPSSKPKRACRCG